MVTQRHGTISRFDDVDIDIEEPRRNTSARRYAGEFSTAPQPAPTQQIATRRRATAPQVSKTIDLPTKQQRRAATQPEQAQDETWHRGQQERETNTEPIRTEKASLHWLAYIGMAASAIAFLLLGVTFVQCWYANASQPLPTTVACATTSNGIEVRGFIDSKGNLDALIIRGNKAQIIPGQNIAAVIADPTHSIVTVKISRDGKTATITARGPYEDLGFVYSPKAAQMNVQVIK